MRGKPKNRNAIILQRRWMDSREPGLETACKSQRKVTKINLSREQNIMFISFHVQKDCWCRTESVQSLSRVQLFATQWTATCQASLSITNSRSLFKLMSIKSVMPSNHLILCHPLLLPPSIFPSIRVFSNESVPCIRWPKYWSFSFSTSPSNEYSELISSRNWLGLHFKGSFPDLHQTISVSPYTEQTYRLRQAGVKSILVENKLHIHYFLTNYFSFTIKNWKTPFFILSYFFTFVERFINDFS